MLEMPTERKCEVYICELDGCFAKSVFGIDAAKSFCMKHKSERPEYFLEGIFDEDFKKDWEIWK